VEGSTLRRSLAAVLDEQLGLTANGDVDEKALTLWIADHLRVVAVPLAERSLVHYVEGAVLRHVDPPLNLAGVPRTGVRMELARLRARLGRKS
jgi:hypothetical protein